MNPSEPPTHRWEVDGPSPPFPYIPGFSIKIRPCTSTTACEIQTQLDAEKSLKARYPPGTHKISAIEYCIARPYCELDTEQAAETSHQPKGHTLHVDSITTRPASDIWWNVVQCHLDDDTESKYTAKIYDPVYASHVTWAHADANGSFNNEVEAYTRFKDVGISGEVTPVFSGAWIMDVPVPSKDFGGVNYVTTRPVSLLLFEAVEAANLATTYFQYYYTSGYVEPQPQLPEAWRHEVLPKIYEARALLAHAGVQADTRSDGVLVGTTGMEDGRLDVRVFIADFERAHISDLEERTGERPEQPMSPIETCWDDVKYDMERLAWDEWRQPEDLKNYRQWLVQRWGESTKYRPLPQDLRKRIACGKWEEAST
ncbi:hypothetical protein LA080_004370 [Diaporthe eres]|uniref:Aminoglycoside phosphotransferase domain-containing protein n=1 Tax=Diaporthe vaccinii TaxID=105482 RepID=A0ABR4F8V6_9PEZI|nr:hypothetical protein LA080_004370 [Diaporthe eres]